MREMGVSCGIRREAGCRKHSSCKGVAGGAFENAPGRGFPADGPWQEPGADVAGFGQAWGKAYLAPAHDSGSKEIVARSISGHPGMMQQKEMLATLLPKVPEGARPVMQPDMGWQCQHGLYCGALREAGIAQSMPRKGSCIGNGAAGQAFGHIEDGFSRGQGFPDFESFKAGLEKRIIRWNTRRRQVKLKGLTPEELRNQSQHAA